MAYLGLVMCVLAFVSFEWATHELSDYLDPHKMSNQRFLRKLNSSEMADALINKWLKDTKQKLPANSYFWKQRLPVYFQSSVLGRSSSSVTKLSNFQSFQLSNKVGKQPGCCVFDDTMLLKIVKTRGDADQFQKDKNDETTK